MWHARPSRFAGMEPVLRSLAGLDSTAAAAVAAAPINAITAFSQRFSGPIFLRSVISLSSFLFSSFLCRQTNTHIYAQHLSRVCSEPYENSCTQKSE